MLILSLFPGADLFGQAFEQEGFCVVRGPDPILGGDIKNFKGIPNKFDGVIGGPPCQLFSNANHRNQGVNLIPEFERVVNECNPKFYIMENVAGAPVPNLDVNFNQVLEAHEFGAHSMRKRRFTSNIDFSIALNNERLDKNNRWPDPWPCILASEYKFSAKSKDTRRAGRKVGRMMTIEEMNEGMGLDIDFNTPCLLKSYQYIVRGNGVPIQMGRAIARAIKGYYDI